MSITPAGRKALAEAQTAEARCNPLIRAIEIEEQKLANYDAIMVAAVGEAALSDSDFFDQLHTDMRNVIDDAGDRVAGLSPRKRTAYLNQRWKEFARKWAAKAREHAAA
ncbi:MAG TPA: hypothetical protein VJN93_13625 [Candidatus Acidoferrum sp.]|nr:hypothetical protein [Candidatus Acidoferrum sp.]